MEILLNENSKRIFYSQKPQWHYVLALPQNVNDSISVDINNAVILIDLEVKMFVVPENRA